uniref:Uncharacterized protein n=1 Tax=Moniliophthora roreri TaxID=221103 RepID=A0A0W0F015_MONRR
MDPLPYNITISAQSLAIIYEPNHDIDSTPESSWNVTYTHGTALTLYGNQEVGNNSLQTTFIVSMKITWIGTAAYLYGNTMTSKPYNIFIDDGDAIAQIYPRNNLLAAVTGLPYRSHTITLNHVHINDVLALHYAVLTIGVGYEGAALEIADASNITPFIRTKSFYPQHRGSGSGSKRNPINEPETQDTLPSPSSNSNLDPPLGINASSPIRETDAGPATLPPEYDHSWASNANLPTPVPVSGSQRRALPIPPGPGPEPPIPVDKVEHEDSEQTVDPSSNSS